MNLFIPKRLCAWIEKDHRDGPADTGRAICRVSLREKKREVRDRRSLSSLVEASCKSKNKGRPWKALAALLLIVGTATLSVACGQGVTPTPKPTVPVSGQTGQAAPAETTVGESADWSLLPARTMSISAGKSERIDPANGAELTLPLGILPEGDNAQLVVSDPNPELRRELEAMFQQVSPFYSLKAQGESDGAGVAQFSLPVTKGSFYLLELFDGKYVALTPLEASSGKFSFSVPVHSGLTSGGNDSFAFEGTYSFSVVSNTSVSQAPSGVVPIVFRHEQSDPRDCGISRDVVQDGYMKNPRSVITSVCRRNPANTVRVLYYPQDTPKVTSDQADQVVNTVEKIMSTYEKEGFSAADLKNSGYRVNIAVKKGKGDPYYSPGNGTIYVPEDSLGAAALDEELAHECAHWVQDDSYNMTAAYIKSKTGVSTADTWWLENSAEYMVTLYKPEYLEQNLRTYGATSPRDHNTPFQVAPNEWNDQLYVHLQLLKVFICENPSVCPLSEARFKEAINKGEYPFDSDAVDKVSKNLGEYARYLLGASPQQANAAVPLTGAVASGIGYGEFVRPKLEKGAYSFDFSGYEPQMRKDIRDNVAEVNVEAPIEKGGVYPLVLDLPANADVVGAPSVIEIEPGTPFYYREGDGEIQYDPGTKKLVLGPVHNTLGLNKIRIVAVAADGPKVFKARVHPVDLEGDWVFQYESLINNGLQCEVQGSGSGNGGIDLSSFPAYVSYATSIPAAVTGTYKRDPQGSTYSWTDDPSTDHSFMTDSNGTTLLVIKGSSLVDGKGVVVDSLLSIPPPKQAGLPWQGLKMGLISSASLALLVFPMRKKNKAGAGLICLALIFLSGCVGIHGEFHTLTQLDSLVPAQGKGIAELTQGSLAASSEDTGNLIPLYVAKGVTSATVDETQSLKVTAPGGSTQQSQVHCVGTMTYRVTGYLFEDGVITKLTLFQPADSDG